MTPRERIMTALAGGETDKVPYQEIFFNHRGVAEYFGGAQRDIGDAARWIYESGQCSLLGGGFWWCGESNYQSSSTGEKRYVSGRLWDMDDVASMCEPDITRAVSGLKDAIEAAHGFGLACHIFIMNGFHSASTAMGLENLCYCLGDRPEVVHGYIEKVERFNRKVLERVADLAVDFVFIDGDCAYKTGLMVSPETLKAFWYGPTAGTVALCHEMGRLCCYHTDGKVDEVIPYLIEMGIDATHGVEKNANDLASIKKRFGKALTLIGNFDVAELAYFELGEIRKLTLEMLEVGSAEGRYIAGCNTLVGENIPIEHYVAYHDAIMEYNSKNDEVKAGKAGHG